MKRNNLLIFLFSFAALTVFSQSPQINWQSCHGGYYQNYVYDVVYHQGAYYLTGSTQTEFQQHSNVIIIKTDTIGNLIWQKYYGGSMGELAFGIFPSGDDLIVAAETTSHDGDISNNPYDSQSSWIFKIDTAGNMIWDKVAGGNGKEMTFDACGTDDGGVITANYTTSDDGDVSNHFGLYDAWLAKYDSTGTLEWDFTYGGQHSDVAYSVIQTSDGGFLAGGNVQPQDGEGNITCTPYNFNSDAFLLKLSADGELLWQQCFGGSNHDAVQGILELTDGYLLSVIGGSDDGDCEGCGYHYPGYPEQPYDIWLVKIDFDGNIQWHHCYGGFSESYGGDEVARNLFKTPDNGFLILGHTNSSTEYGPNGDVTDNPSSDGLDHSLWMIKTDSLGNLMWEECIGSAGNETLYHGAIQRPGEKYVVTARTNASYEANHDVDCGDNIGNFDYYCFWLFEMEITGLPTSSPAQTKEKEIKLYPNPGKNTINIVTDIRRFTFSLYGATGQEVVRAKDKNTIATHHLREGLYFYRITKNGKALKSGKWVKE